MRIIAVDPGYGRAGIAVLEKEKGQKETLLTSLCIETDAKRTLDERLVQIGEEFEILLKKHKPASLAMETLFFGKNKKTAIAVAEMRGVFRFIAAKHRVAIFEYNPMTVKSALSAGDKKQIQFMVERLIKLPSKKRLDDEYDAIAIGLTHLAHTRE